MEKRLKEYLKGGKFLRVSKQASKTMSAIRGKNNKSTEVRLRMQLVRIGIKGWELQNKELPGVPDFYFKKKKLSLFVDGCYWHGCPFCGHIPKTRTLFWAAKIRRNKERDRLKSRQLKKLGISVVRIWEHELKAPQSVTKVLLKIKTALHEKADR